MNRWELKQAIELLEDINNDLDDPNEFTNEFQKGLVTGIKLRSEAILFMLRAYDGRLRSDEE